MCWLLFPCPWCPWRDDEHEKDRQEKAGLREENSRLRKIMIQNGLEAAGSIYVRGERPCL